MTRDEARDILSVSRPDGRDDEDPIVAEAFMLAQSDPELLLWLQKERAMDLAIAAKLASFPVPENLKDQILGDSKIVKPSFFRRPPVWAALAAVLILMLGIPWMLTSSQVPTPLAFEDYRREISSIVRNFWVLNHHSSDVKEIQEWLAKSDSPFDFSVPPKLDAMTALGCRRFNVEGNNVSLLCFKLRDGKTEAHLFVIDRKMIENAPPENVPVFAQKTGWSMAFWSDEKNVYILASQADPETLKTLL